MIYGYTVGGHAVFEFGVYREDTFIEERSLVDIEMMPLGKAQF